MQKLARTSLQIARPLTVIGFKRHARQIPHLVWIIHAAHDMHRHRHGQKTEEDMERKHFTVWWTWTSKTPASWPSAAAWPRALSFPSSHGHVTFTVVRWCWQTSTRLSTSAYITNQTCKQSPCSVFPTFFLSLSIIIRLYQASS